MSDNIKKYKVYKLAFRPTIIENFLDDDLWYEEFEYDVESIYFLTDNESWFDLEHFKECFDLGWEWNVKLIVINNKNNTCIIKTIGEDGITDEFAYNSPWYEYLEENFNRKLDLLFCNKKYSYFEEQIAKKNEQFKKNPVGKKNLDEFLDYLEEESKLYE